MVPTVATSPAVSTLYAVTLNVATDPLPGAGGATSIDLLVGGGDGLKPASVADAAPVVGFPHPLKVRTVTSNGSPAVFGVPTGSIDTLAIAPPPPGSATVRSVSLLAWMNSLFGPWNWFAWWATDWKTNGPPLHGAVAVNVTTTD